MYHPIRLRIGYGASSLGVVMFFLLVRGRLEQNYHGQTDTDICLGQRMMMFRLVDSIIPECFMFFFWSPLFKNQYQPFIGGTTSPGDIKGFLEYRKKLD